MNYITTLSLDSAKLVQELHENTLGFKSIVIMGSCSAVFDGRIKSDLKLGKRILLIKPDTSIILHGSSSVKPLNWQKANDGVIQFKTTGDGFLEMFTYRPKTKESFQIIFSSLDQVLTYDMLADDDKLAITGHEKDFVDFLVLHPEFIEEGIKFIDREKESLLGFIDLFAVDSNNVFVIIEVKKQNATPKDAYQLLRYIEDYEKLHKVRPRGFLISSGTPSKVKIFLEQNNLEFRDINWQEIFPAVKRKKTTELNSFL